MKLTPLQQIRIRLERKPITYFMLIPIITYGLLLVLAITNNETYLYLLIAYFFIIVAFLNIVTFKTNKWWYGEYYGNKYSIKTQVMKL